MKKKSKRLLSIILSVCLMFSFPMAVSAYDFSGQPPKTVALEGVDGYVLYGGTGKIGMTWSTNDPEKLVAGFFNHIKKDGVDIPVGDPFYVAKPEGSGNDWFHGPKGYLATTITEFQSETAKWKVENVTRPHVFEFSAKGGDQFTNNIYEYEEHLVGSPAKAHLKMLYPVTYDVSSEGKIEYPIQNHNAVTCEIAPVKSTPVTGNQSDYAILDENLEFDITPVSESKIPTVKYSLDNGISWNELNGNKTGNKYKYTYKRTFAANPLKNITDGVKFNVTFTSTVKVKYEQGTGGQYNTLKPEKAYNMDEDVNVDFSGTPIADPGKVFLGWESDDGELYTKGFTSNTAGNIFSIPANTVIKKIKKDTTLTSVWSEDKNGNNVPDMLEVTFTYVQTGMPGAAGGNADAAESQAKAASGNTPTVIADPAADTGNGYEFKGWNYTYKGKQFTNVSTATIKGQTFTENVKFTAQFGLVANTTVTWNLSGGSWTTVGQGNFPGGTSSGPMGATLNAPKINIDFEKEGYDFTGWDVAPSATFPNTPVTYTAQWSAKPQTLTYEEGSAGTITNMPTPLTETHNTGSVVTAATAPVSTGGYTFQYWKASGAWTGVVTAGGTFNMPAGPVTLTAVWLAPGFVSMGFDPNGGQWSDGTNTVRSNGNVAVGSTFDVGEIPVKTGYTFDGWSSSSPTDYPDLSATETESAAAIAGKPVVYTAKWNIRNNNVTYMKGSNGTMVPEPAAEIVTTGNKPVNVPVITADTGYVFIGWKDSINGGIYDKVAVEKYIIDRDVTFTAQYSTEGKAIVVFNYDGGTDGTAGYKIMTGDPGNSYTAPIGDTDFSRAGFSFDGWDIAPTGTFGLAGQVVVYTAKWNALPPGNCTVKFLKGDHGNMNPAIYSKVLSIGTKIANVPTVTADSNYAFTGWLSSLDGAVYSNVALKNYILTGDVTFTAQYVSMGSGGGSPPPIIGGTTTYYVLSFQTNGGSMIDPVNSNGDTVDLEKYVPKKPGNIFLGWYSEPELKNRVKSVLVNKNITVYAKWSGLTSDRVAYMIGYADNTFGPDNKMSRAEAAMMFYRLLDNKSIEKELTFSDVPEGAWYTIAVRTLASKGIILGYDDGRFGAYDPITRAQFAAIASRFENLTKSEKTFKDVPDTHWAYTYINSAATKGWINGYPDGNFRPENNITRAEVVTVVNNVLQRKLTKEEILKNAKEFKRFKDVSEDYWAFVDVTEATNGKGNVIEKKDK